MKHKKMNRILGIFLTMVMVIGLLPSAKLTVKAADTTYDNADTSWYTGQGNESNPYIITDEGDLLGLAKLSNLQYQNFNGKYIRLDADIDISDIANWPGIGSDSASFFGSFDGNNHTISGMKISSAAYQSVGLFKQANACTIKNVNLTDVNINAPDATLIGGITAYVGSSGSTPATIDNCSISGTITVSGSGQYPNIANVGGIVGWASGSVTISNCTNNASVIGPVMNKNSLKFFGGVVGSISETYSTVSIEKCGNTGTVSGGSFTGGIVGYCSVPDSSITACYNSGTVSGGIRVGGIAGSVSSPITKCFNSGIVSAAAAVEQGSISCAIGGVAGLATATISSCYSTGTVSAANNSTATDYAGGVVGAVYKPAALSSCYAGGGTVTSPDSSAAGGVVGGMLGLTGGETITISNCFFDTERTGLAYADANSVSSAGALLTADMTSQDVITTGAMSALGMTDWVRKIYADSYSYYPELIIFEGLHIADASVKVVPQLVFSVSPALNGTTLSTTLNRVGTVHYVIVAGNATAPSAAQIIAGTDYSGTTVLAHGSQASDSDGAISIALDGSISNFTSGSYSVYAVGTDADDVKTAVFPTFALSVQTDNALAFGEGDYVSGFAKNNADDLINGEFTVEFELKTPTTPVKNKFYEIYVDNGPGEGIIMRNSCIGFICGSNEYYSADVLQSNTRYHIAVVCNPAADKKISIYIDGVDKGIQKEYREDPEQPNGLPNDAIMGGYGLSYSDDYDLKGCVLDNFKIWNYAAADEAAINQMKEATTGAGLLRYYDFNQGVANGNNSTVSSLPDKSSYATSSGTLNGFDLSGDDSNWVSIVPQTVPDIPSNGGSTNNGGSTDNSSSTTSPSPMVEKITVDVKQGDTDSTVSQITIERSTGQDGKKTDSVTYQEDKAVETIKKLKEENKDTARIVIPDEKDVVSETKVNIPSESISALSKGEINLEIDTEEAKIDISKNTIKNISKNSEADLYFNLVPVKDDIQKEAVAKRALLQANIINGNSISVIGNPIAIETNMTSTEADITLPLTGIKIPTDQKERAAFVKQLAVYIEHSDGEKELIQGELVEYKEGLYGIRFNVTKFSTFTIVKTDAFLQSSACDLLKINVPSKAIIKGTNITATVENKKASLVVKAIVSNKAEWKLYSDKACTKEIANHKLSLKKGSNTVYLKIIAEDKKTNKVYILKITRKEADKVAYNAHIKLGLIGSKTYAEKVAKIFEQDYDGTNAAVKKEGKYYRVYVDFTDKAAANKACEDMVNRNYIVNYYYY